MRDFLFRGKLPRGEWLYGVPIKRKGDEVLLYTPFDDMHIVRADTLGEYTGINDKNGTKIFEGDIVRNEYDLSRYVIVTWSDERMAWTAKAVDCGIEIDLGHYILSASEMSGRLKYTIQVVGNIYDNKELFPVGTGETHGT